MPDTPVQAAPVLDYDPQTAAYVASRARRRIVFILCCGVLGALIGFCFSFGQFRAVVHVKPPSAPASGTARSRQQSAMTAMASPASLAAGVASARINGVTFTPAEVARRLRVRAIPGSEIVEVAATHETPEVAAAIAGGVANGYVASNPSATIVGGPAILARQQIRPTIVIAGVVAGLVGGWVLLTLRRR